MTHRDDVQFKLVLGGIACWLLIGAIQTATAALLIGNANAVLSGTVPLLDSSMGNLHYGDIEYAVFSSAGWQAAFPGEDTPNGGVAAGEAVYAFQVYDNGANPNGISQFSAGLADLGPPAFGDGSDDDELVNSGDQDYVSLGGQVPTLTQVTASSVRFNFVGTDPRLQSEWSSVLFYTSPYGPTWDNGSTTSGAGQSRIPAPEVGVRIPEPSALVLAIVTTFAALFACKPPRIRQ
jgi:hypothetical protein